MLKKVIDMKLSRTFIAVFLAVIMLLALTACASSGSGDVPPKFDALLSKYGAPKEEVVKALGISEADLKQPENPYFSDAGNKDTGLNVSFCGADFDLILQIADSGRVAGFSYFVSLEDKKVAAEVVAAISAKAKKLYGKAVDFPSFPDTYRFAEHTAAELEELFKSSDGDIEDDCYSIQPMTTEAAQALLPELKEDSVLNNLWGDEILLTLTVKASYGARGVNIILEYLPYPPDQIVRS